MRPTISLVAVAILLTSSLAAADRVDFNRDVRPILSENCYHCHGPDGDARQANLRLDTHAGVTDYAIVPFDSEASEVFSRIIADDPDTLMPPPDSERSLTPSQIELIRRWIDQGPEYQGHWSLQRPTKIQPPSMDGHSSIDGHGDDLGPIDCFIHAELEAANLRPAGRADRETLIRRATFDLLGLPPTIQEIDAFLADQSPGAYERVLDRLLARVEFGERMASDWLDAARYSDTYGYQVDRDRFVWPWRDWVVRAFNDNLPYDEFLTQQLAGDLIPGATRDQILATTFNRLHPQKVEGGSVPEEFRIEYVADRTQTVATAMLGLTFECCRCHTHKYDPITQSEYYQLSSFFDNIDEAGLYSYFTPSIPTPTLTLPNESQQRRLHQQQSKVEQLQEQLDNALSARRDEATVRIDALDATGESFPETFFSKPIKEMEFEDSPPGGNTLVDGVVGKAFRLTGDDAVGTNVGNFRRWEPFSISLWVKTPDVKERAVILHRSRAWTDAASRGYELLIDEGKLSWSLIHFWPGNAIGIRAVDPLPVDRWTHVAVTYDGSTRAAGLRIYVDGQHTESETVRDALTKQITGGGGDTIAIGERFRDRGFKNGSVDRLRVFDCELTPFEVRRLSDPHEPTERTSDSLAVPSAVLIDHFLHRHDDEVGRVGSELKQAREQWCATQDAMQEIMVMREMDRDRPTFVLKRGAYDQIGPLVEPGTPAALPPFPVDAPRNRLGLARWMCDPQHPLTGRVAVNRLWQLCFGSGLVRTPEDFGSQGASPTHPALLDWLAVDFVENGWDVKRMLRMIMASETYRRTSQHEDPSVASRDPSHLLLARFPSYRLPAEMLRDNALAISGRLVATLGGPPVKPYELAASFKPSEPDQGAGVYRRSLYTYWKRTGPAPAMMTFDAAKRDVCRVQREKTSSPLQAFVLLNGPQYVEAARGLAERLSNRHRDDPSGIDSSIREAFRVMTSRQGTDSEVNVLTELYAKQLEYFAADAERTAAYLSIGQAVPDPSIEPDHLAAMTVVVSALMNFDQSMMKR